MAEGNVDDLKTDYDLREVFRQTYFLSQGDSELQGLLYKWLRVKNIFKYSDFPPEEPEWLNKFQAPRLHAQSGQVAKDNEDQKFEWANFKVATFKPSVEDDESLLIDILTLFIKRDLYYQVKERPNRDTSKIRLIDGANDSHKSFVRHYVLNDNFLSEPFSALFHSLKPVLNSLEVATPEELERITAPKAAESDNSKQNWVSGLTLNKKLGMLIKFWEKNHPGYKFFEE